MIEINRIGDIETVKPDPELMKIANRVIDLNEKILAQNAELIVDQRVSPKTAEDKFEYAISVLNEIEGQMHQMENIDAKTFNRIMDIIAMRRNFLHKGQ